MKGRTLKESEKGKEIPAFPRSPEKPTNQGEKGKKLKQAEREEKGIIKKRIREGSSIYICLRFFLLSNVTM